MTSGPFQPFPVHQTDNDYSGVDLARVHLKQSDALSHAFMNGTNITGSLFESAALDQIEFGEALINDSRFDQVDLEGSDFVRTRVARTVFRDCSFVNGEWRESEFEDVDFEACRFDHTTINLCTFRRCRFNERSVASLNHRSVNYNTWALCLLQTR